MLAYNAGHLNNSMEQLSQGFWHLPEQTSKVYNRHNGTYCMAAGTSAARGGVCQGGIRYSFTATQKWKGVRR